MRLERLAKDDNSGITGCQTVYLDEGGWLTFQGPTVDEDTFGNLDAVLPGEGAVRLKPEIVIEALRRYQQSR